MSVSEVWLFFISLLVCEFNPCRQNMVPKIYKDLSALAYSGLSFAACWLVLHKTNKNSDIDLQTRAPMTIVLMKTIITANPVESFVLSLCPSANDTVSSSGIFNNTPMLKLRKVTTSDVNCKKCSKLSGIGCNCACRIANTPENENNEAVNYMETHPSIIYRTQGG